MKWKCPHCNLEINYLDFEIPIAGTETGTVNFSIITTKDENENDILDDYKYSETNTDSDGDYTYFCPECNNEIRTNQLIWVEQEQEKQIIKKEEILEETQYNIITPKKNIIIPPKEDNNQYIIICKNCKHPFAYQSITGWTSEEEIFDCPKCGTSNTIKEYKELLEKNFFNEN